MPGTLNLCASKAVSDELLYASENGKLIGAICAAPSVLGGLGLLKGKKATCYWVSRISLSVRLPPERA